MNYLISIIIPVYNAEKYIESSIIELEHQTYNNIEVILIDDGSNDNSGKLCDSMADRYENIKVIHQKNQGVSCARNRGTSVASGEYLIYLDADDIMAYNAISNAVEYISKYNADMVIGYERMISPSEKGDFRKQINKGNIIRLNENQFDELRTEYLGFHSEIIEKLKNIGSLSGGPCSRLIKTAIAKEVPFPNNIKLGEDKIWNLRLLKHCKQICIANECWYGYVIYENSSMWKYYGNRMELGKDFLNTLYSENQNFCDEHKDIYIFNIAVQLYCVVFYELLATACPLRNRDKRKYIRKIIKDKPWSELWENKELLPKAHRCMLPLYKCGLWIEPLSIYKWIKNNKHKVKKV